MNFFYTFAYFFRHRYKKSQSLGSLGSLFLVIAIKDKHYEIKNRQTKRKKWTKKIKQPTKRKQTDKKKKRKKRQTLEKDNLCLLISNHKKMGDIFLSGENQCHTRVKKSYFGHIFYLRPKKVSWWAGGCKVTLVSVCVQYNE